MRAAQSQRCGCFPTGRHYPGIADLIAQAVVSIQGLSEEFSPTIPWTEIPWAVIDFETTGLDPEHDRVIEVGVVCFDGDQMTARENFLVNPGIPVSEEARSVHGITDEEIANAPRFGEIIERVASLLRGRLPVAYNAEFDRRFLHLEIERIAWKGEAPPAFRPQVAWLDPLVWAREVLAEEKSKKLTEVAARLEIPLEIAHRAAGDAEAAGRVLLALSQQMPKTYSEVVRIQGSYAAHQDVEFSLGWRAKRPTLL